MRAARYGLGAVVLAAGASGVAMLAFPASTGSFFSWELEPAPLASLVGGFYVASSFVFAYAMRVPWEQARSLVAAAFVLTAPTFVATMIHLEVFDLGRWQAWFWVLLFGGAPWFWLGLLGFYRGEDRERARRPSLWLLTLAVALVAAAVIVWVDPVRASRPLPLDLAPMGGRFVGAWLGFLAVLSGWAAFRPAEARLPFVALAAYPAGALVAGVRSIGDLAPPSARYLYLVVLAVIGLVFLSVALRERTARGRGTE